MWFLIGVFTYRFLATVFAYSHMLNFLTESRDQGLLLLACNAENIAYIQMLKYKAMEESDEPADVISRTKSIDDENFQLWKTSTIFQFQAIWPKKYYKFLGFSDWNGAMDVVDKIYKKRKQ